MQPLFRLPFELPKGSRVLLMGAGGGSDVVCALPVGLALRHLGHEVWFGSLASVIPLPRLEGAEEVFPHLYRVGSNCQVPPRKYCPEGFLAAWWQRELGEERPVWGLTFVGVEPTAQAYRYLVRELEIDTIVILDAGVDALFYGNEHDPASPEADAVTLLAAYKIKECRRVFGFNNFGTEGFEYEVRHADALRRMAELTARGALLGSCALAPRSEVGQAYLRFVEDTLARIDPLYQSNMVGALYHALKGAFGDTAVSFRTESSKIWVSPLTLLYWFFDLDPVAEAKPYLGEVLESQTARQVADAIFAWRDRVGPMPRADIPI